MKAAVFNRYGGNEVVEIKDMPKPECGPDEVMIKVRAAGINPVDWKVRYGHARIFTGSRFPKILGNECAGEIVEVGKDVRKFVQGDRVIGFPGVRKLGAFAEYASVPESLAFLMTAGLSFEQAASIPIAGLTALQALRDKGRVSYSQKVLINGASGGVGHFAVQIGKIFGAEVIGVSSGRNAEFVKSLGADRVIDYTKEDFTRGTVRYDIVFDAAARSSFNQCRKILTPHGIYVSTLPSVSAIVNQYLTGHFTRKKAFTMWVRPSKDDLQWMMEQIKAGKIKVIIDKVYPLGQAKEALAFSETGRVKGKILLIISQ